MAWAPDAHQWHRLWSVRFAALGAAASVVLAASPSLFGYVNPYDHPGHFAAVCAALFGATLVSRLIDQPRLDSDNG